MGVAAPVEGAGGSELMEHCSTRGSARGGSLTSAAGTMFLPVPMCLLLLHGRLSDEWPFPAAAGAVPRDSY